MKEIEEIEEIEEIKERLNNTFDIYIFDLLSIEIKKEKVYLSLKFKDIGTLYFCVNKFTLKYILSKIETKISLNKNENILDILDMLNEREIHNYNNLDSFYKEEINKKFEDEVDTKITSNILNITNKLNIITEDIKLFFVKYDYLLFVKEKVNIKKEMLFEVCKYAVDKDLKIERSEEYNNIINIVNKEEVIFYVLTSINNVENIKEITFKKIFLRKDFFNYDVKFLNKDKINTDFYKKVAIKASITEEKNLFVDFLHSENIKNDKGVKVENFLFNITYIVNKNKSFLDNIKYTYSLIENHIEPYRKYNDKYFNNFLMEKKIKNF